MTKTVKPYKLEMGEKTGKDKRAAGSHTTALIGRGDLWQVTKGNVRQVGVVLGKTDTEITVIPVIKKNENADEWTILLTETHTSINQKIGVAVAHRFLLPWGVFDKHIGGVNPNGMALLDQALQCYQVRTTTGMSLISTGTPVVSRQDKRVEATKTLTHEYAYLTEDT